MLIEMEHNIEDAEKQVIESIIEKIDTKKFTDILQDHFDKIKYGVKLHDKRLGDEAKNPYPIDYTSKEYGLAANRFKAYDDGRGANKASAIAILKRNYTILEIPLPENLDQKNMTQLNELVDASTKRINDKKNVNKLTGGRRFTTKNTKKYKKTVKRYRKLLR